MIRKHNDPTVGYNYVEGEESSRGKATQYTLKEGKKINPREIYTIYYKFPLQKSIEQGIILETGEGHNVTYTFKEGVIMSNILKGNFKTKKNAAKGGEDFEHVAECREANYCTEGVGQWSGHCSQCDSREIV